MMVVALELMFAARVVGLPDAYSRLVGIVMFNPLLFAATQRQMYLETH